MTRINEDGKKMTHEESLEADEKAKEEKANAEPDSDE